MIVGIAVAPREHLSNFVIDRVNVVLPLLQLVVHLVHLCLVPGHIRLRKTFGTCGGWRLPLLWPLLGHRLRHILSSHRLLNLRSHGGSAVRGTWPLSVTALYPSAFTQPWPVPCTINCSAASVLAAMPTRHVFRCCSLPALLCMMSRKFKSIFLSSVQKCTVSSNSAHIRLWATVLVFQDNLIGAALPSMRVSTR